MDGGGLSVGCLGRLEVTVDGRPLELPGTRLRAALVRLALQAGTPVPHHELSSALWDEEQPADPRASLHTVMTRLRTRLGILDSLRHPLAATVREKLDHAERSTS